MVIAAGMADCAKAIAIAMGPATLLSFRLQTRNIYIGQPC